MTRLTRPALFVVLLCLSLLAFAADQAKLLYEKGADAEARQNYEQAYDYFKQAFALKPKDLKYRASYERTRFLSAASHVHRGQIVRDGGKLEEALAEFQKAAEIDPSSFIAQQELRRTQQMIREAANPQPQASAGATALRRRLESAQGPVELTPISNVPITLKLTEDAKVIYETIGKLAGINVLFDPDYTSRRVRIELNGVTLEDALEVVSFETKTFWRPVTPNTIFVAQDNPAKRKELEQNVIKTFYLSNLSQPTELQDVVNAMRTILEVSRIQQLPSQGAIVVRGTPDQMALAQKLVDDLDRAKPEVLVEVAVMQVSRDKLRNLGISPPTSATVALQPNITQTQTGGQTQTGTQTSGSSNSINLNRLANLNATDFQVTIPPASVTALLSDSNTKLIQNPQIRALDGQKATLKIGDRVPVATGSFQPGIGGVGINPLVNTQFQYLDVGVNIDITPRVHAGREVTLKMSLDISAVTSRVNIGGIDQPVIGQRKIEHEIRLKDGEVNLLGGILEDQQTKALSGIPGLASVPILKYLFSQTNTEHRENEIVFVLVPHIIRGPEPPRSNLDMLDVGTANALELRRTGSKPAATAPASGQGAAPQPPQQPQVQPAMPQPAQPIPQPPAPQAGAGSFLFDPPALTQAKGATFTVNVMLSGGQNVYSVPLQLNYDPNQLQVVNVSNGGFLSQDGQAVALVHRDDPSTGTLQITATRPPGAGGVSGQGAVITLTFMAKTAGQSALTITRGGARDPAMQAIAVSGAQAAVTVQ
ncbi:MAG: type II and III secretion system protein [Acidobacteriales bacterium]|nr:type II and III secretion system protein [Candidatus Koribacter versatilis]MBI3645747.1 type II and III secretion system protein [Terriglobales bacterium]